MVARAGPIWTLLVMLVVTGLWYETSMNERILGVRAGLYRGSSAATGKQVVAHQGIDYFHSGAYGGLIRKRAA